VLTIPAGGNDVDKMDLWCYNDLVDRKLYDLLMVGDEAARLNGQDAIEPFHLPIAIDGFRKLDEEVELDPILEQLAARPPLDMPYGEELEALLAAIVGGLSVALAQSFKIVDSKLKKPSSEHWQRCFEMFELLL
jgi:hypothetical protein